MLFGDVTGDVTGNADTALATARNIGGVSFNGTANINRKKYRWCFICNGVSANILNRSCTRYSWACSQVNTAGNQ